MSTEDAYIKNIENGIRAIKLGTKTPAEANVGFNLNRLKNVNPGMHDDLMKQYKEVLENRKGK